MGIFNKLFGTKETPEFVDVPEFPKTEYRAYFETILDGEGGWTVRIHARDGSGMLDSKSGISSSPELATRAALNWARDRMRHYRKEG